MFTMPPVQVEKQTKKPSVIQNLLSPVRTLGMVGVTGFEPAASRPPDVCANQLRYTPKYLYIIPLYIGFVKHKFSLKKQTPQCP